MTRTKNIKEIRIIQNGPYVVTGGIPLLERKIVPKGRGYVYEDGDQLPQSEKYALCRCGKTSTPPFCDGSHTEGGFCGQENASKSSYQDRSRLYKGQTIDIMDDNRCAMAGFCHRENGDAWGLAKNSELGDNREEAIIASNECPAGRLTAVTKDGKIIEPDLPQAIIILQDSQRNLSSGIYVQGYIPIKSAAGDYYETRNRVVLCRCGKSSITPFCDATHIKNKFRDWDVDEDSNVEDV